MSTMTEMTLTQQIAALLDGLYGNARGYVRAIVGRGETAAVKMMPAGRVRFVPPWLLTELEFEDPDDICLSVVTTGQGGHALLDLAAAWTEIPLPPVFDKRMGWVVPQDVLAAARARLDAFGAPPSFVIDGAWTLLAAWLLDLPLALDVPEGLARAERAQRALAEVLGGLADEQQIIQPKGTGSLGPAQYAMMPAWHPARPALRLPGSRNHDRGATGKLVLLAFIDVTSRYDIEEIEAALGQEETR